MFAPKSGRALRKLLAQAHCRTPELEAFESRTLLSSAVLADFMPTTPNATWLYSGTITLGGSTAYAASGSTNYVAAAGTSIETNSFTVTNPGNALLQSTGGFTRSFVTASNGAQFSTESVALPSNEIWSDTYSGHEIWSDTFTGQQPTLPSVMAAPGVYNTFTSSDQGHIDNSSGTASYVLSVTSTETYQGLVSVTTPAGTFLAAKITEHRDYALSPLSLPNLSAPGLGTLDYTMYLVQGVGIVRKTMTTTRLDASGNPITFSSDFSLTQASLLDAPAQLSVRSTTATIASGDTSPTAAKGTAFGSVNADGTGITQTFVITNTGSTTVHLGGISNAADSIFFTPAAQDFTVTKAPALTLAPGATTRFKITFTPTAVGVRPSTLYIMTTSPGIPYSFKVRGTGTPVLGILNVAGGTTPAPITNGATTASNTTGTRFGQVTTNPVGAFGRRFIISNSGTGAFQLTGPITITGANASDFSIISENVGSLLIPGSSSIIFRIRFSPTAVGLRTAFVNISSDSPGAPVFRFKITGTGV